MNRKSCKKRRKSKGREWKNWTRNLNLKFPQQLRNPLRWMSQMNSVNDLLHNLPPPLLPHLQGHQVMILIPHPQAASIVTTLAQEIKGGERKSNKNAETEVVDLPTLKEEAHPLKLKKLKNITMIERESIIHLMLMMQWQRMSTNSTRRKDSISMIPWGVCSDIKVHEINSLLKR